MRLYVGQARQTGDLRRYASRFNLLEVPAEPGMPKRATLARWAAEVPPDFAFSLVLPAAVSALDGSPIDQAALDRALAAADALGARWLLLRTPPSARPSARTRRRLGELVERLQGERRIAWDPRGLWEDDDAESVAGELGVWLVRDVSRSEAPEGDVVYSRLRALGAGGRVSGGAIERAIDQLEGRSEAYVVIEGEGAVRAALMLRDALGGAPAMDEGHEEDYEGDESEDDEESEAFARDEDDWDSEDEDEDDNFDEDD